LDKSIGVDREIWKSVDYGMFSILLALQEKISHEERLHIYREQQQAAKQQTEQLTNKGRFRPYIIVHEMSDGYIQFLLFY
jgi:hypothetical protein